MGFFYSVIFPRRGHHGRMVGTVRRSGCRSALFLKLQLAKLFQFGPEPMTKRTLRPQSIQQAFRLLKSLLVNVPAAEKPSPTLVDLVLGKQSGPLWVKTLKLPTDPHPGMAGGPVGRCGKISLPHAGHPPLDHGRIRDRILSYWSDSLTFLIITVMRRIRQPPFQQIPGNQSSSPPLGFTPLGNRPRKPGGHFLSRV